MIYLFPILSAIPQQPQASGKQIIPISCKDGLVYTVNIIIGNQHFDVQLDTGSSNLWVPGVDCTVSSCSTNAGVFNPSLSKTFTKEGREFNIPYVTGTSVVQVNQDYITIGGLMFQSEFEISTSQSGFNTVVSGMLGIGYADSAIGKVVPPFITMFSQFNMPKLFGIYLNKEIGINTSELVVGGINEDRFTGVVTYAKISDEGSLGSIVGKSWSVNVDQVILGTASVATNIVGIIDSGASLIIIPKAQADLVNRQLNPTISNDGNLSSYEVDCAIDKSTLNDIAFQISGVNFSLKPDDYIVTSPTSQLCVSAFRGSGYNQWIIGDVFLRKYYTIYDMDNDTIGFAVANHQ